MTIELHANIEVELRKLADQRGLDLGTLVEEAVRRYLEAEAITDLDSGEIADAQIALAGELRGTPGWHGNRA